jgi:hypothetical protein
LQDLISSLEIELSRKLLQHKTYLDELQNIEEERNFYYEKMRSIENNCKVLPNNGGSLGKYVLEILSATPEDFLSAQVSASQVH